MDQDAKQHASHSELGANHRSPGPRGRAAAAMLVVLAAFIALRPSLDNGYSFWDDQVLLSGEAGVPRGTVGEVLVESFRPVPSSAYYPLYRLSIATDLLLWGEGPLGHHLTSVALHALAAVLVYWLALGLFGGSRDPDGRPEVPALAAGLLFAVHPLCVEPVAWICGRKVQVAVLFALLAFRCYLAEEKHWAWRGPALVCFLLACLSNSVVASLPLVLIAHATLVRGQPWWRGLLTRLDFVAVAAVTATCRLVRVTVEPGTLSGPWHLNKGPWSVAEWLPVALKALWEQSLSVVWPVKLSHIYSVEIVDFGDYRALLGGAAVVASLVGILKLRKHPLSAFLLAWFGLAMLPSVAHHIVRADRHLYLPLVSVCWAAGAGFAALHRRFPAWIARAHLAALGLALVGLLTHVTHRQCTIWQSPLSLWTHALEVNPEDWRIYRELGLALTEVRRFAEAADYLRKAVAAEPDAAIVRHNLARALVANGEIESAITEYRQAVQLDPTQAGAWNDLAVLLIRQGKLEEAEKCCQEALRQKPDLVEAYTNLADLRARDGDFEEAIALLRKGIEARPTDVTTLSMLAQLLTRCPQSELRNGPEAVRLAERACQATGWANPDMLNTLAAAYAAVGSFDRAVTVADSARDLATQLGRPHLAAQLEERLLRYRAGQLADD